jgi:hypothetical protein
MRITDFENLIKAMPVEHQSFDTKYQTWKNTDQSQIIDKIFESTNNGTLTLSRFDLFNSGYNLDEFVIKVLMWGYPTKGRGKNINTFLEQQHFCSFIKKLKISTSNKNITISDIYELLNTKGLGFSTLSKIMYFKKIEFEGRLTLILDFRVIKTLNSGRFNDPGIENFKNLRYENSLHHYSYYLDFMHSLAIQLNTQPDRIEMFLYEFGMNLKEPI